MKVQFCSIIFSFQAWTLNTLHMKTFELVANSEIRQSSHHNQAKSNILSSLILLLFMAYQYYDLVPVLHVQKQTRTVGLMINFKPFHLSRGLSKQFHPKTRHYNEHSNEVLIFIDNYGLESYYYYYHVSFLVLLQG